MDPLQIVDILSRILHVGTAIVLAGGSVFLRYVVMPAAGPLPEAEHDEFRSRLIGRWKRVVHIGVTLLLVTGFYNYYRGIGAHEGDSLYHALIGTKMLLAFAVFFIAAALVGRSAKLEGMRTQRGKWLTIAILLVAIIVSISGFLKIRSTKGLASPPVTAPR